MLIGGEIYKFDVICNTLAVTLQLVVTKKMDVLYISLDNKDAIVQQQHTQFIDVLLKLVRCCHMYVVYTINAYLLKNVLIDDMIEQMLNYNNVAEEIIGIHRQYQNNVLEMIQDIEQTISNNTLTDAYVENCILKMTLYNDALRLHSSECLTMLRQIIKNSNI